MFGPSRRDLLRIIERERQQHRVEIANLLDRLANATDKPWLLPPRTLERTVVDITPDEHLRRELEDSFSEEA